MNRTATVSLLTLALLASPMATAQQATEVYIPIGESPGVSGKESVIGSISAIEYEQHRMTVSSGDTASSVTITPKTRFYLDKSGDKSSSVTGDFNDCRVGRRIEAYLDDNGDAIWIKIAAN